MGPENLTRRPGLDDEDWVEQATDNVRLKLRAHKHDQRHVNAVFSRTNSPGSFHSHIITRTDTYELPANTPFFFPSSPLAPPVIPTHHAPALDAKPGELALGVSTPVVPNAVTGDAYPDDSFGLPREEPGGDRIEPGAPLGNGDAPGDETKKQYFARNSAGGPVCPLPLAAGTAAGEETTGEETPFRPKPSPA